MWSDMFYRLGNKGEYCALSPVLPQKVIDLVPDVELCYWDYYNTDETMYDAMLTSHERFGKPLWFACGAWTCMGFAPLNHYALKTIAPAMKQVAKHKVENVLVTLWADNGNDCSNMPTAISTRTKLNEVSSTRSGLITMILCCWIFQTRFRPIPTTSIPMPVVKQYCTMTRFWAGRTAR